MTHDATPLPLSSVRDLDAIARILPVGTPIPRLDGGTLTVTAFKTTSAGNAVITLTPSSGAEPIPILLKYVYILLPHFDQIDQSNGIEKQVKAIIEQVDNSQYTAYETALYVLCRELRRRAAGQPGDAQPAETEQRALFGDWPDEARAIANRLLPMLCRHGATVRPVNVPRQVRVGWLRPGQKRHPWVAILSALTDGSVDLKLRVSRDSGFLAPDGPLQPARADAPDSERDTGIIRLSTAFPALLPAWIDNAFAHCVQRYRIELTDPPLAVLAAEPFALPDEQPPDAPLVEGATRQVTVNAYERDPRARLKCIEAHGTSCAVCGFNFGATYGLPAEGYIHVHHLRPLSEVGAAHVVDPVADLRPVCPNCHAVLHRRVPAYSIEDVQAMLR